jgi:mannose-6-phosphate isomerase-like protein (cupin superfamily)
MQRTSWSLAAAVIATLTASACTREPAEVSVTSAELKGPIMRSAKGFVGNIDTLTTENTDFRRVLYTAKELQLVLMSVPPGDHIGEEVHDVDQFIRVEQGTGEVVIDDTKTPIGPDFAVVIPKGRKHDVINTGTVPLRVYTIYSPPHHREGVVHPTRAAAEQDTEHFDGTTTP